jgi:DNA-binding GntR family transcriptional regulator
MTEIVKKSLSEQIYEDLKHRILTQDIVFGEKLTNRDLQSRYGVSSTPVRDAIFHLHRDGLVEYPTRTGARVKNFDLDHALEINEMLSMLSVSAIRLSAQRSDVSEVGVGLLHILGKQEESVRNETYYAYDREFHKAFFDYAKNRELRNVYMQYYILHEMLVRCYHRVQDTRRLSVKEHRLICEAYSSGDIESACSYMSKHYRSAEATLALTLK